MKTKTKHTAALLLLLGLMMPLVALAQHRDCNGPITITTEAPYTQGFESPEGTAYNVQGPLPDCWEGYTTGNIAPHNTTGYYIEGSQSLSFNYEGASYSNGTNYAYLPEFTNPLNELKISFYMYMRGDNNSSNLQLGYITAENNFFTIETYDYNPFTIQRTVYLLNVPTTAQRLAFRWTARSGNTKCIIDNVEVAIDTDCHPVNTLRRGGMTASSAYLSWNLIDNSQEAWDVQVATNAAFTENVANHEADTHENYLLTGLEAATYYHVRVKPSCSTDLWSNTIGFKTPCNPITITHDSQYFEDFGSPVGIAINGPMPDCWEKYEYSIGLYTYSYYYAVWPEFSNPISDLTISFRKENIMGSFSLGYLTADDNGTCNTFTEIANYPSNGVMIQYTEHLSLLDVPVAAKRLAFRWSIIGDGGTCYIGDVNVSLAPDCYPVGVVSIVSRSTTYAYLSWTLIDNTQTEWDVQVATNQAFTENVRNYTTDTHENFLIDSLIPETFYFVRVKPSCSEDQWTNNGFNTYCECCPVYDLSLGEVFYNSAYLSWDLFPTNQAAAWDVQVATDEDFTNILVDEETDTHENYLMEGLSPGTQYYVRVKPTCSEDQWSSTFSFTTLCGYDITLETPYTQDFEDGVIPNCWDVYPTTGDSAPYVYNSYNSHSGSYSLMFDGTSYAVLPEFNVPLNLMQISFWVRSGFLRITQLQLGYITAEDDGTCNTFTAIADYTINVTDDWTQYPNELFNVPNTAHRLAFKVEIGAGTLIDDVEVSLNPCATPVDLTCTGVTGTTATLAWTSAGESWQIMLNDDENNLIDADTNPFTLTDLTPDLTYNAQVRTACGNEWSEIVSFMPTENLYIGSSDGTSSYLPLNNYYNYSLTEQIYTAEELGETGLIERIGFFKNHNKSCERDIVIYMAHTDKSEFESTSDWITVTEADRVFSGTVSFDDYSWTDITLDEVFVYDGLHNVVIVVDDNTSSYLSTTNFSIYNTEKVQALYQYSDGTNFDPTGTLVASRDTVHQKNLLRILKSEFADCMKPSRLVATEVAPDFVVLDWEEYGTSENWLVSYDGTFVEANDRPFTLTGLAPETEYTIAVSPICDTSLWSRHLTLTTRVPCPAPFNVEVDNITYNSANVTWTGYNDSYTVHYRTAPTIAQVLLDEGFEGGVMPDGWYVEGDTQDTTKTWRVGVGDNNTSTGTHSGNYNALITHFTNGNETYLITPVINLSGLSNLKLSFWYINRIWSGDIDGFAVCYREGDYGDWEELWSTIEAHASWTFLTISLTGLPDNCQIGFRMTDNYGRGVGLDDILIGAEQIGEWEEITTTATSQALSSLVSETEYEVYVTADCDSTAVSETVNFTTPFVMTKDIVGYGESAGGYHLIASPVAETVAPTADNGFITSEYDLFYFDHDYAGEEWQNWKVNAFNLESGTGYLYASQENTTLFFPGTPYTSTEPVEVALAYNPDASDFGGWNLVGNPFATTAFVDHDFYTMNSDGTEIVTATSSTVEAMEGIFVIAEGENESVTFSTIDPDDAKGQIVLNLSQGRGTIDRAIVRFDEGRLLPKFQLNTSHTKVYIPQGGKDYAIVSASRDAKSCVSTMDVNFKAAKNGTYTLTFSSENVDFDYLHLIDNLTGADVDLLAVEPVETATETGPSTSSVTSYTFTAKTTDYASRFKLVFSTNDADGPSTGSGTFAYISNGNIVINGEGTLQVIDAMGRVLVCRDASDASAISTAGMPAGVYILRLIDGDSVRTQKMVID
jgi:hypothetical protein